LIELVIGNLIVSSALLLESDEALSDVKEEILSLSEICGDFSFYLYKKMFLSMFHQKRMKI
jgi:hypothetical protein